MRPSLAANTRGNEALVAFLKNDIAGEGAGGVHPAALVVRRRSCPERDRRPDLDHGPATPTWRSAPTSARTTTATYHPLLDQYFVTWAADNDLPGLVDNEFERYGQALDGAGARSAGTTSGSRRTASTATTNAAPEDGATAASATRRAWLHVWEADDNRPPMADNEFELFGRLAGDDGDLDGAVAPADCNDANASIQPGATDVIDNGIDEDCSGADTENLDRDADGSARPADCNDANPSVRPGAADIADNGVDEDCSGADAVNLDRDGDGSLRPVDCNDANAAIRPGARDIPRNKIDEDCSGKDAAFPTLGANVSNAWDVNGAELHAADAGDHAAVPEGHEGEDPLQGRRLPLQDQGVEARQGRAAAPATRSRRCPRSSGGSAPARPSRSSSPRRASTPRSPGCR